MLSPLTQNYRWHHFAWVLSLLGAGVSLYALRHHLQVEIFGNSNAACNISEFLNCDRIAKSQFSKILGVPLGALGFAYFSSIVLSLSMVRFARASSKSSAHSSYCILVLLGVLTSIVLGSISFFAVGALCITCMSFYLLNAAQGVLVFIYIRRSGWFRFDFWRLSGLWLGALILVGVFFGYKASESKITHLLEDPSTEGVVYHKLRRLLHLAPKQIPVYISPDDGSVGDIWLGNPNAKVVFVEFIDYTCPMCMLFAPDFWKIFDEYSDRVLFVMKHAALGSKCTGIEEQYAHPYACETAMLAFCAVQLGRYKDFQRIVFEMEPRLKSVELNSLKLSYASPPHLQAAKFLGLTDQKIEACLNDEKVRAKLFEEIKLAWSLGSPGTPKIYINGWSLFGAHTVENIRFELDYLLAEQVE